MHKRLCEAEARDWMSYLLLSGVDELNNKLETFIDSLPNTL